MNAMTYSGWSLQVEDIFTGTDYWNPSATIRYIWGADLSGTLDGAGGVPTMHNAQCIMHNSPESHESLPRPHSLCIVHYELCIDGPARPDSFCILHSAFCIDAGLYYYGYRYYSPELGRWLTRDPIEEDGGDNLYAFCGNNGVNRVDAWGLEDNWTETSARWYLLDIIAEWRDSVWDFAADALYHFLYGTGKNADLSRHAEIISTHRGWQNAFINSVAGQLNDDEPSKEIGDIAHRKSFSDDLTAKSFQSDDLFNVMFEYRFYPIGNMDLFYALYGARFSYLGKAAKRKSERDSIRTWECCVEVDVDMDLATWDALTYPDGFFRRQSKAYRAAMFLESLNGKRNPDYIFLRWHESGTWKRCYKMQGRNYKDTHWEKLR